VDAVRVRSARSHPTVGTIAAAAATCLALVAGALVGTAQVAEAATIPDNPCVAPAPTPVTTRPVLTDLRISDRVLDVRRRPKTLVVTLHARDTVAVSRVIVTIGRRPAATYSLGAEARRVSGPATDGTWRAVLRVPSFIPDGPFQVQRVQLWDAGGGSADYGPGRLGGGGWARTFRVLSYPDRVAPRVSGFRVSTRAVDTTEVARTIRLRVTARDNLSGVTKVRVLAHGTDPALVPAQAAYRGFDVRLTQSRRHEQRWTGRVVVPTWAGTSRWAMSLRVKDDRRHVRRYATEDLVERGWQSTLRVTSRRDPTEPTLAALSWTPSSVDARTGAARLEVTARVTDVLSGPSDRIEIGFVGPRDGWADVVVTSVTGPPTDRTYRGYAIVPRCGTELSTWTGRAYIFDNATNDNWVGPAELDSLDLPSELEVRQVDTWPPTVSAPGTLLAGGPITLQFSEPVLLAGPMAGILEVEVDGAEVPGTWVCRDGADQVVVCDADGADVVTASFAPTAPFEVGERVSVLPVASPPARIGIYNLGGVPLETIHVDRTVT
jgi:hypothetical protein